MPCPTKEVDELLGALRGSGPLIFVGADGDAPAISLGPIREGVFVEQVNFAEVFGARAGEVLALLCRQR